MEVEQIQKQVDWLENEHRKDKKVLDALEGRLAALEGNLPPLAHQIKEVDSELTRVNALLNRFDQFDNALLQQRVETKQYFDELERQNKKREEESEKVHRVEMRSVDSNLAELRKELEPIPDMAGISLVWTISTPCSMPEKRRHSRTEGCSISSIVSVSSLLEYRIRYL